MRYRTLTLTAAAVAIGASLIAGCHRNAGGPGGAGGPSGGPNAKAAGPPIPAVDVSPVGVGTIINTVAVTGNLDALNKATLSAKTTGRLLTVTVREGDRVRRGQIVAQQDPTELQAQIQQFQAAVENAQIKVQQASTQYHQSITNAQVAVNTARSQLAATEVNLQKTITGQQPEAKQQVRDQLLQQQANYQNAETNYKRQQQLYSQGAIAKADLDNAETQYNVQKALLDNYKQALALSLQGGRPEDIAAARQSVKQAQLALNNALANQANVRINKDAISAAQAQVRQNQAQVAQYRKQLYDLNIVSPLDGYVTQRSADPGQIVSPGSPILNVVDVRSTYYQPTISQAVFDQIHPGQPVSVAVDAYPGRTFAGKVIALNPSASTDNRQFSIRVAVSNPNEDLRPGMYARGQVTTAVHRGAIIVPITALVPRDINGSPITQGSSGLASGAVALPPQKVFLLGRGNKALERNVEIGIVTAQTAEITSGLSVGDKLIVKGQTVLRNGDKVKPVGGTGAEAPPPV